MKAETCIALVLHAFCLVTVSAAWVIIWKVLETSLTHQPHCSSSGTLIVHANVCWWLGQPQPPNPTYNLPACYAWWRAQLFFVFYFPSAFLPFLSGPIICPICLQNRYIDTDFWFHLNLNFGFKEYVTNFSWKVYWEIMLLESLITKDNTMLNWTASSKVYSKIDLKLTVAGH